MTAERRYYKVAYKGVVALLSEANTTSERSGTYVSYGEIVVSTSQVEIAAPEDDGGQCSLVPASPPRSLVSHTSGSVSSLDTHRTSSTAQHIASATDQAGPLSGSSGQTTVAICVDEILTGGYSMDKHERRQDEDAQSRSVDQTPKRTNSHFPMVLPSPLPVADSLSIVSGSSIASPIRRIQNGESDSSLGFIISHRQQHVIAEPMRTPPPTCESGTFLYKVLSSSPLPILTGPSEDAPKTKAMLLPGTIHEVCLRVQYESVGFLRLARKRGWVADHKSRPFRCMKDVTDDADVDCNASISSATTVATPVSVARRRHRPPRRRLGGGDSTVTPLPRHVINPHSDTSMDKGALSPSSNISMLSDESSLDLLHHAHRRIHSGPALTPDRSVAHSSTTSSTPSFYLMRVNAPRGLKILDAPHFQVSNLIHGGAPMSSANSPLTKETLKNSSSNQSLSQNLSGGHHATSVISQLSNPAVFDPITKARKLPRGAVFEASSKRMEGGGDTYGRGLIKLSDHSGWAIIPKQSELESQYHNYHGALGSIREGEATRALEEVGNAVIDEQGSHITDHHHQQHNQFHPDHRSSSVFLRIVIKGGVTVSLPPMTYSSPETSPTSSTAGSSTASGSGIGNVLSNDSDVSSSVGSSFLDSMFRTPRKKDREVVERLRESQQIRPSNTILSEKHISTSFIIPCGACVEVERWVDLVDPTDQRLEFVRLRGGQGWIPRHVNGKVTAEPIAPPETRFGSFWFRVQSAKGIKVRDGPSRRAPSIKSSFRFECGEYLRASEILTIFREDTPCECYAKLYRNRHVQLQSGNGETRPLASLTTQAEWVQVFNEDELFLEECATEPRIERHRDGWRYNVVLDTKVQVRKGPSFAAESINKELVGGESVLIDERVTGAGESITWLRLKDGRSWVHNYTRDGEALMIPHALRHRKATGRATKSSAPGAQEDMAYNTIVARLFHSDLPGDATGPRDMRRNGNR